VSGAHFNPAVSLVMSLRGVLKPGDAALYAVVQIAGCCAGAILAHAMFELPLVQAGTADRSGFGKLFGEAAATFALVFAILSSQRWRPEWTPAIVALVITAGYWWTSSTSFANPAITVARSLTDTFAGIRWIDAPGFILAQLVGTVAGSLACDALFGRDRGDAAT
jgi:glycerol uptake facilitator-like aquaporin